MKTQEIKQKKRYQVIADNRKKIADKLMETMGVSQDEYGIVIFQSGAELLDNYFGDLEETPYIAEMKKQLLTDANIGYWQWFQNQRHAYQVRFWAHTRRLYMDYKNRYGKDASAKILKKLWHELHSNLPTDNELHERLRQFIIKTF